MTKREEPMKIIISIILMALTFYSMSANADQWSLLINGKSIHFEKSTIEKYNEENYGVGVQYDFSLKDSKWVPFLTASGFKDSYKNPSYYAGGGAMYRHYFGTEKNKLYFDIGLVVFAMTRKNYQNGDPFLGMLPMITFGNSRVALNMTYVPKIDPKMVPIVFFQIKVGI